MNYMNKLSAKKIHEKYDNRKYKSINDIFKEFKDLKKTELLILSQDLNEYKDNFSHFNTREKNIFTILRKKNDFIKYIPKLITEIKKILEEPKTANNTLQENKKRNLKP